MQETVLCVVVDVEGRGHRAGALGLFMLSKGH